MSELLGDGFIAIEFLDICGGGDDQHELVAAFFGLADDDELHPVGGSGELFEIGFGLGVGGELVVVADIKTKKLFGGRDVGGVLGSKESGYGQDEQGQREASLGGHVQ